MAGLTTSIGAKLDSVMERVRQAQAQAPVAEPVKPTTGTPDVRPTNPNDGRYLDSFQDSATKKPGLPVLTTPEPVTVTDPAGVTDPPPTNNAKAAQEEMGWKTNESTVMQTSTNGCAEATLTFLEQSDGEHATDLTTQEAREKVRNKADTLAGSPSAVQEMGLELNLDDGATPDELGAILGSMGIEVTSGSDKCNPTALSNALNKGQYAVALVDSNALLNTKLKPKDRTQEPGQLHWITIDAVDRGKSRLSQEDDRYHVRDSVNGDYWVHASDMKKIVSEAQSRHGSGGIITVQMEKGRATKAPDHLEKLARKNLEHTAALGDGNGGASRRASIAESS
ncbi:hypothetical protein G4177_26020 [Corallococcus sp. ZKHCc1 1396]|uniref:Uncharacterized protein n=1 Tax=Corallococcus soli TaxID=2710757 RepID=A0ABR9PUM0_9BACT|nr:hypothetical protein [Corallococcus soli]MBE4751635.1 hypothetical protein [Corallococcus soli]